MTRAQVAATLASIFLSLTFMCLQSMLTLCFPHFENFFTFVTKHTKWCIQGPITALLNWVYNKAFDAETQVLFLQICRMTSHWLHCHLCLIFCTLNDARAAHWLICRSLRFRDTASNSHLINSWWSQSHIYTKFFMLFKI